MSESAKTDRDINEGKQDTISTNTISRSMHELGYWAKRPCRKPVISDRYTKKRLALAV